VSRYERYLGDVAAIRAVGRSVRGWVSVVREPSGDLEVQIRPGMLRTLTAQQVAEELRTGLLAALADHRTQFRQLRIDYFGGPLGVAPFVDPAPPPLAATPGSAEALHDQDRRFQV